MLFSKYDALQYISFSLKANGHTADTSVYVYPYSPSSSSPSTPLPTTTDTAPTITTTELDPATVGEEYSFQLISSAVANWTIKGKLPAGLSISSTGLISGTPTKQGSSKITFIAENTLGEDKKTLTLTVYELPAITTESLKPATVGKKYKETIKGTGSKPLTWEFDADLPDGLTLDTNKHKISGKPTSNTYGTVKVTLSNPAGSVTKTFWLFADAILPEIKTKKLKDGTWNKPYKAVIKAKGTDPINLEWEFIDNGKEWPEGLTFNESTGELSGTPTETCYDLPLRIYAENMGGYMYKDYTLTIKAVPPKFTTTKLPDALKGEEYSAKIEVTGTPEITLAASGLPAGLSMNTSGEISGTPTTSGNFKVSATSTNVEKTAKKGLTLNVLSAPEFREGSSSLKSGIVGKSYKYTFSADGTKKITFSIASGSLPSGVSLSTKGKLSGKPTSAGVYNFTVKAANSIGEAAMDFSITITNKDGSMTSDETSSAAPSDNSAVEKALPAESETPRTQEAYPESESESVTAEGEGCEIVAVLPEVSVDVSGMYDFADVVLDDKAEIGAVLVWLANSGEPASDDNIAEFSGEDGREIKCVPENRKVNVSVWLNAGRIYKPAIAVQRIH